MRVTNSGVRNIQGANGPQPEKVEDAAYALGAIIHLVRHRGNFKVTEATLNEALAKVKTERIWTGYTTSRGGQPALFPPAKLERAVREIFKKAMDDVSLGCLVDADKCLIDTVAIQDKLNALTKDGAVSRISKAATPASAAKAGPFGDVVFKLANGSY